MRHPLLRTVVGLRETTVPDTPGVITNTNRLLAKPGVVGLKTGSSTPGATCCGPPRWGRAGRGTWCSGAVLGQRAHTTPAEGMAAALTRSGELIDAVRQGLPAALIGSGARQPVRS